MTIGREWTTDNSGGGAVSHFFEIAVSKGNQESLDSRTLPEYRLV